MQKVKKKSKGPLLLVSALLAVAASSAALIGLSNVAEQANLTAVDVQPSPTEVNFSSCAELWVEYPFGVGLANTQNRGGFLDGEYARDAQLYAEVSFLDSDNDRIACEIEKVDYAELSCDTKTKNNQLAVGQLQALQNWYEVRRFEHDKPGESAIAFQVRNELSQIYTDMIRISAPQDVPEWNRLIELSDNLRSDWDTMLRGRSTGDTRLTNAGIDAIPRSMAVLEVELERQKGNVRLLPICN